MSVEVFYKLKVGDDVIVAAASGDLKTPVVAKGVIESFHYVASKRGGAGRMTVYVRLANGSLISARAEQVCPVHETSQQAD